jgi:hypothetical protein
VAGGAVRGQAKESPIPSFEQRICNELRLVTSVAFERRMHPFKRIARQCVVKCGRIEMNYLELSSVMFAVTVRAILILYSGVCVVAAVFVKQRLNLLMAGEALEILGPLPEYVALCAVAQSFKVCVRCR